MLSISHHQTAAYSPEANKAVERLHCRLPEEIPWVLLDLCSQPREDMGLSSAEAVLGAPLVFPNEFLQNKEFSVDQIIKQFSKIIDTPAFSLLSKHNLGH
jgi:hypothetical protein